MKKITQASIILLFLVAFSACKKSNEDLITLTPSTTQTTVGQTVSVALSTNANVSNWTVSPSSTATQSYGLTTSKVNYYTFSQPGVYTVSVSAKKVDYNPAIQTLNAAWNTAGGSTGRCTHGVDSTSVTITIKGN